MEGAAANVLLQICGDRLSAACDRVVVVGSMASNLLLTVVVGAITFIAKVIMMVVTLILKLICRGELKTTCNAVAAFGSKTSDFITYACQQTLTFVRDSAIPAFWQGTIFTRDFIRVHIAPLISKAVDVTKDALNEAMVSTTDYIVMAKQQTVGWIRSKYGERISNVRDLTQLATLLPNNLDIHMSKRLTLSTSKSIFKDLDTDYPDLLPLAVVILFIILSIKLGSGERPKSKLETKRSLDTARSRSGFLNWDDDLEDDDDQTIFTNSRRRSLRYLEEEYPAVDMNSDADVIGGSSIRLPDIKGPAHTIFEHMRLPQLIRRYQQLI
jgi:hypothetical protein